MEIIVFIVLLSITFLCVFFHWQSLTKFTSVRAFAFYSHYQNLSSELSKFPLDPTTDYVHVVANTIDEAMKVNRLSSDAYDNYGYAFEVVQLAYAVATNLGRIMAFRDVVLAAVLLDLESKNRKPPSRYLRYNAAITVEAIIPPHF